MFRFFGPRFGSGFPLDRSLIRDDERPWLYLCLGLCFFVINAADVVYFSLREKISAQCGRLWPLLPSAQLGLFGRMVAMVLIPSGLSVLARSAAMFSLPFDWSRPVGAVAMVLIPSS